MKSLLIIITLFFLASCGVDSRRKISSQFLNTSTDPKQVLLQNEWRSPDVEEVCEVVSGVTQKCTRFFKVLVFTEATCIKKQIEENSKKVVSQRSDTISDFNQNSFFVTNFDEHYTYEINGGVLELCAQGASCFSLVKYIH